MSDSPPLHFIQKIIRDDLSSGKAQSVVTRFPPEPNGYLHLGHAKSICLNFSVAQEYGGICNLRFDDTNPEKESVEYIEAIKRDVKWLGFEWAGDVKYASDYFQALYDYAESLITQGKAYVCSLDADMMRAYRGTLTEPGKNSPDRDRSMDENLDLFRRMRAGEFKDGAYVLRAKIDMASPNVNLRDPVLYRIRRAHHHQTGDEWCIYPMYDYTHCISDAEEHISHSLCSLEFQDHRPLYDWVLDNLDVPCHPQQIEFGRLNLNYTITSKRKLKRLVNLEVVDGWDDPRMATLSGVRRRGFPPSAIREFCDRAGVTKNDGTVDIGNLEYFVREELNKTSPRAMAVLDPLKVVITNYPEGQVETLTVANHPQNDAFGSRAVPFAQTLYIDRADFAEVGPRKWKRLETGKEVRLRGAYVIRCDEVIKEGDRIVELRCSYDADTLGKNPEGRKVKGVIHWVSAEHAMKTEVRLYDRLFSLEDPESEGDFIDAINPHSLRICPDARLEPSLADASVGQVFQFEREGYFCRDCHLPAVFNRTITLRDSWAKAQTPKNNLANKVR